MGKCSTIQERCNLLEETTEDGAPRNHVHHRKQPDQQIQEATSCSTPGEPILFSTTMSDCHAISSSELTFKRSDQVYIKSKGEGQTQKTTLKMEGAIPKCHVPSLEDEE